MTYDEMIAKYGDVEVMFSSYDKHVFTYEGYYFADMNRIMVYCCGNAESAYEHSCSPNSPLKLKALDSIIVVDRIEKVMPLTVWSE